LTVWSDGANFRLLGYFIEKYRNNPYF
jgi:hypothetical protein